MATVSSAVIQLRSFPKTDRDSVHRKYSRLDPGIPGRLSRQRQRRSVAGGHAGAFSPNIAGTSSVQACVQTVCSSTAGPPSPFSLTVQFSEAPSSGGFSFDYTDIAFFGAGSPVGSYILFGQLAQGPQISGVVSASAFGEFSAISPGSWIEIYGTNLAVGTRTWGSSDFNGVTRPSRWAAPA